MTLYQLSCDKRVTMSALALEIALFVTCILIGDALLEIFGIQSVMASHITLKTSVIVAVILQYLIVATELIARNREDRRGFTLPLVFLPGGILVRFLVMSLVEIIVVASKLIAYFLSVLLAFLLQIAHLDRYLGTARLVDGIDHLLEPLEYATNRLYNLLYFNKIRANTSVFSSVFNASLSFWCINH